MAHSTSPQLTHAFHSTLDWLTFDCLSLAFFPSTMCATSRGKISLEFYVINFLAESGLESRVFLQRGRGTPSKRRRRAGGRVVIAGSCRVVLTFCGVLAVAAVACSGVVPG